MSRDFPMRGLDDVTAFLSAVVPNIKKNAVRAGLVAAAAPVRDEARVLAKKASGEMARDIKTGSARENQDGSFSIRIRLVGPHAYIGYFQEWGVAPHFIAPRKAGLTRITIGKAARGKQKVKGVLKIGDRFVSGMVTHPGHAAHPFMRPALDTKAEEAVKAFGDRIRAYIEGKTGFSIPAEADEAA